MNDVTQFSLSNDETPVRELFVPCYLIDHNGQQMIWDAGLPDNIAGQGEIDGGNGMTMQMDSSMAENLALVGLTPNAPAERQLEMWGRVERAFSEALREGYAFL